MPGGIKYGTQVLSKMNKRLLRTFISIPVPPAIIPLQKKLQPTINAHSREIRWIPSGNLHLTLKFIGDTPEDDVKIINSLLADKVKKVTAMNLFIAGTGCFPKPERPRILWLGCAGAVEELQRFAHRINKAMEPLGYPIQEQEHIPHLTLARIKYPQKKTPRIKDFLNYKYEPIKLNVNKIHFMSSQLFLKGSVYTILGTHFLK